MPTWLLSGPMMFALAAPIGGDRDALPVASRTPVRVIEAASQPGARAPIATRVLLDVDASQPVSDHGRRVAAQNDTAMLPIRDPQADSVRALLRDRLARRGGAVDARVEWRLSAEGSDVGIGGGLARVVDTLLHD